VSGAKISDAIQVVQSTIKPVASAPKSNINETQSGKVQKTMDQARQGARACLPSTTHTHAPWLYHPARARVRFTPTVYLRHTTNPVLLFLLYKPDASTRLAMPSPQPRRQILEELGVKSSSILLEQAAIKLCTPSRFTTFDEAWDNPGAKHSVHHGPTGPVRMVELGGMTFFPGPAMVQPEAVLSNVLEPSAAPEAASAAEALGPEPLCAAASPAVMKPKSTAAVAKASVVTAAPPQRAAVPKLSAAASMPSTDLKPSATAFKLAADTTSLKVSICYVCTHNRRT